jgi:hypothetical protein
MSPTCNNSAMRVLMTVLLASSVANAVALPHQVLDSRAPAPMENAELAAEAFQAAADAAKKNPTNFFEDVSDQLNHRTAWEVFRDFFERLFGPRDDDDDGSDDDDSNISTTTVYVTELPFNTISDFVVPTPTPAPESEIIFSILPIGDLTTSINATTLTPIFVTAPESDLPFPTTLVSAPYPILNLTSGAGILPTAASISGSFSVLIPLITDVPVPVETAIGAPVAANTTEAANITVVVVTETVTPVPVVLGTGTAVSVSVGTGLPIVPDASPIWPNSTYSEPTAVILPLPIGTGTAVLPIGTGTAIPIPLLTGTAPIPAETALPTDEPLFPNTTVSLPPIFVTGVPAPSTAVFTLETEVPLTVTGVPGAVLNLSFTIPTGPYANATAPVVLPIGTAVPVPVSVGTILPTVGGAAPFANVSTSVATETETVVLPEQTVDAGTSVSVSLNGDYAG